MSEEYSLKFHLHNTFDVFICDKNRSFRKGQCFLSELVVKAHLHPCIPVICVEITSSTE